jgi:hypothetical protein
LMLSVSQQNGFYMTEVPDIRMVEPHYTVQQVSKLWHRDEKMVRKIFRNEPAVVSLGSGEWRYRRAYKTLRIPESIMVRVHPQDEKGELEYPLSMFASFSLAGYTENSSGRGSFIASDFLYAFCMQQSEMYPFYPFYPFVESITCVFATLARVRLPPPPPSKSVNII